MKKIILVVIFVILTPLLLIGYTDIPGKVINRLPSINYNQLNETKEKNYSNDGKTIDEIDEAKTSHIKDTPHTTDTNDTKDALHATDIIDTKDTPDTTDTPHKENTIDTIGEKETDKAQANAKALGTQDNAFATSKAPKTSEEKDLKHKRNRLTDNLNILFIGKDQDKLLMLAVHSINYKGKKKYFPSGGVFFKKDMQIKINNEDYTLGSFFKSHIDQDIGILLKKIVEEILDIKIAYYVLMDKKLLAEADKILEPIIIEGESIKLEGIFEMPVSYKDNLILGELMKQLTGYKNYFYTIPKLVIRSARHIKTDFPLTYDNLQLHFRIARDMDRKKIKKIVLEIDSPEHVIKDVIFQVTN
jgi:hypothetical protein